jgi:hypothetical protein
MRILQEVSDLLQSHHIDDEAELYTRVGDCLINGEGVLEILEQEISQDELDEIRPQLEAISTLGLPSLSSSSLPSTSSSSTHRHPLSQIFTLLAPLSLGSHSPLPLLPDARPSPQTAPPPLQEVQIPTITVVPASPQPNLTATFVPAIPPSKNGKTLRIVIPDPIHHRARNSPQSSPLVSASPRLGNYHTRPHTAPPALHLGMLAPLTSSKSSPRGTYSLEWQRVFRRHSVFQKFHDFDFNKIEEWAIHVKSTSQIAKQLASYFQDTLVFNKKIYSALFFHIKRQLDLGPFVESLLESLMELDTDIVVESEQYSVRMFINLLLSNCDHFLRLKLIQLISTANPIPITEFILEGDAFTQQFIPEPCSILEDKFLFFSFGIDKCKGKSTALNKIFGTTFETSKDSQFFNGTIDCQGDKMFVPSRGVVVVDGHGDVSIPFKLGLFQLADGIILHIQNDTWNSDPVQVRHEIEMAVQYGVKLVVVLVRDAVESLKGKRILDSFRSMDLLTHLGKFRKLGITVLPNLNCSALTLLQRAVKIVP